MKQRIDIENIDEQLFKIKIVEPDSFKPASFTHYLHNYNDDDAQYYKKDALSFVKERLSEEYLADSITDEVAEEALTYCSIQTFNRCMYPISNASR